MIPLQVDQIERRFGAIEALRGVSFAVQAGEIYGLVGPDGAGKTTTIRMAAGLMLPDKGRALVLGQDPSEPEVREQLVVEYYSR